MIIMIAAASENNALGKNNELVWHLPNDFKRFKSLTSGHHIIMGRKTFESFPKPLPNRTHVIITRQENYEAPEGCIVVNSLEKAIRVCPKDKDNYIIGGGQIYLESLPYVDRIELTRVHSDYEGDTFFPEINSNYWVLIDQQYQRKDEKHNSSFSYLTYDKVTNFELDNVTVDDLISRIECEGLSYAVTSYYGRNIKCDDLDADRLWKKAYDSIRLLEKHLSKFEEE